MSWNPFEIEGWTTDDQSGWDAYHAHAMETLLPMIGDSAVTISLCPHDGEADVKFALELGFSIMLSKPIIVVVDEGGTLPEGLAKVATAVVRGDLDDDDTQAALMAVIHDTVGEG